MKANKLTVFLRCAVSLLLCTVLLFSSGVAQGLSEEILNPSWRAKINDDLWEAMEGLDDDDIVTVWLWKQSDPIRQSINTALRAEKGMDPDVYEDSDRFEAQVVPTLLSSLQGGIMLSDTSAILSRDSEPVKNAVNEVKAEYAAARKEITRREYTKANTDFVEKYVDEENRSILYFSNYTSTLILEATRSEIIEYAKTSEVTEVSLFIRELQVAEEDVAFEQILADSSLGTKSAEFNAGMGYKGSGVTIGIIEAEGGYYDDEHPQLRGINGDSETAQLRILNNATPNGSPLNNVGVTEHATHVTTLLVGQTAKEGDVEYNHEGIVPLAKAIVTPVRYSDNVVIAIRNLTDAGCTVINYSGGSANGPEYSNYDKEVDQAIINSNVVFVKSAGNIKIDKNTKEVIENTISVSSPGKAANAITVGNAHTKSNTGTKMSVPYKMISGSSYREADYMPNKPDIAAPGNNLCYTNVEGDEEFVGGTSIAAPIVTGVIAQMMEANTSLKNDGKRVKSILLASADYHKINPMRDPSSIRYNIYDCDAPDSNFLREVSGAGLVNALKAVNVAKGISSSTEAATLLDQAQVGVVSLGTLLPGEKVRIVLTFNKVYRDNEVQISSTHPIDNINLSLWNTTAEVANSNSVVNNVEIIEYIVPPNGGGVYHCDIDAGDMYSINVPYSVTWIKWLPGDLNGDGSVNTLDHTLMYIFINNYNRFPPEKENVADVNKDGVVDVDDLSLLADYLSGEPVVLQ